MPHTVITGASSGLGAALAVELGRRGQSVGLIARREGELAEVAAQVRSAGGRAAFAPADVTDRDAVIAAVRAVEAELGPTDRIVAGAGSGAPTPAARFDAERLTAMMRLNYDGVVNTFAAVLPQMVERGDGHIVAISSIAAWRGLAPSGGYSASKAAVSTLMEAFYTELRPLGVAVTTIHPGFVRTPLTAKNKHPMPFLMEPEQAARIMATGLERRKRSVDFPTPMALLMGTVGVLPASVFHAVYSRVAPKPGR